MKNFWIIVAVVVAIFVVVLLFGGSDAEAANCDVVACGNGDPMNNSMVWGLTGYETPQIATGQSVTDRGGITDTCPSWYPRHMGCFDITGLDYYESRMIETAQQLIDLGIADQFPYYAGWVAIARNQ